MAKTVVKNYNITPYYDDFDETKGFHRILFKPGVSVQARELTQLQTALQAQLDRLGQFAFKEGDAVVNGEKSTYVDRDFIKVESSFVHSGTSQTTTAAVLTAIKGSTLTGQTNGVTARVYEVEASSGSDPHTIYLSYEGSGTGGAFKSFVAGEVLQSNASGTPFLMVGGGTNPGNNTPAQASAISNPIGQNSFFLLKEGVFFLRGNFVYVEGGSITLDNAGDKYTQTPNGVVGFTVSENLVNSNADSSLVDNALGAPNFSAPGADRYQISTTLTKATSITTVPQNFVQLAEIKNGAMHVDTTTNEPTTLDQILAERTHEESGNYTVQPMQAQVKEHLDNGSNFGQFTNSNGGDADKISLSIQPSVAYIEGYRVQTAAPDPLAMDKPRSSSDENSVPDFIQTVDVGNFMKCNANATGAPPIDDFATLNLFDSTGGSGGSGTIRGTARARAFEMSGGVRRLYLFDITMNSGFGFSSVRSVEHLESSVVKFRTDFLSGAEGQLFGTGANSLVFPLPFEAIKTAATNTSYTVKKRFTSSSNQVTVSGGTPVNEGSALGSVYTSSGAASGAVSAATNISGNVVTFGNLTVSGSNTLEAVISVRIAGASQKTKTASSNTTASGTLTNNRLSLGHADVYQLISVVDAAGNNITEKFTLDTGQRDSFYDLGAIELKSGFSNPGTVTATFKYYSHGSGDYFSAESYPVYEDIGNFDSIKGRVRLRDAIDFRPRKNDAGTGFTGTGSRVPNNGIVADSTAFEHDIVHFMSRIDNVHLNAQGEYAVTKGVPAINPVPAATPDKCMSIFEVLLDPYVFNVDDDVHLTLVDNKRYTMRDIGKLDKRLKNMEYFTSLSLLEQNAADIQIRDASGDERLKNGFIVDSFFGTRLADTSNPEYSVAMDRTRGVLRPQSINRNINLVRKAGDSASNSSTHKLAKKSASLVHLDGSGGTNQITEVTEINQPFSSFFINVNPFNIFSWTGTVDLSPDSDEWKDVDTAPQIFIDDTEAYDQFKEMVENEGILGTVWNEWETDWVGVETSRIVYGVEDDRGNQGITTQTTTTTSTNQSQTGLLTELGFDTVTRSDGTKVVQINIIPFMRSRVVNFKAQLLKPNTRMYAFFDGQDISNFTRLETFTTDGSGDGFFEFSDQGSIDTHEGKTQHPDGAGETLTTNASGVLTGSFLIPRNDALKFATGSKLFRLSDDSQNRKHVETSSCEAEYHAVGMLEVLQETVVSTKVPKLVTSELKNTRVLTETVVEETTEWEDPLAQTILIDRKGGYFCSSVECFFRSKDTSIPVRLTIRTTRNGIPTQNIVPGADRILYPDDVSIASDLSANNGVGNADQATKFSFDFPVYLQPSVEYAIVLTSACDSYEAYIAQMGGNDLTDATKRITKQPYNGVFFTSQNASTWTPEQSKDLKFKLNRADFDITKKGEITLVNDVLPPKKLKADSISTTSGSKAFTVHAKNHGMYDAANEVIISEASGVTMPATVNNIPKAEILGTHTISSFTHDTFTIANSSGTAANATGFGGGSGILCTQNAIMDVLHPYIQNLQVPGTNLKVFAKFHRAKSADGNEANVFSQDGNEIELLPNRNFEFALPRAVFSSRNETANMSNRKSIELRIELESTDSALTPVIDMNRCSTYSIQNRINSQTGSEAVAQDGPNISKYFTKVVSLDEPADVADVFVNVKKPSACDVEVYFRTVSGSDVDINTVAFIQATPDVPIPSGERFREVRYQIDPTGSFAQIQFKIVLRSTSSSKVPEIKDFRAICST